MRHWVAVSAILLVCALAAPGQSTHLLKPKPLLPIDCSGNDTQPRTGTQCTSQQADFYRARRRPRIRARTTHKTGAHAALQARATQATVALLPEGAHTLLIDSGVSSR